MKKKIRGIGISANKIEEYNLVRDLIHLEDPDINIMSLDSIIQNPSYLEDIDFIFTIGGDGSVAWLVKTFFIAFERVPDKPIVPVVRPESIGYLKQIDLAPDESFREGIRDLINGNYEIIHRTILKTWIDNQPIVSVNEVYLVCQPHVGRFDVYLENDLNHELETVTEVFADGIMLVTPIGSTAWGLSHGGYINANEDALELIFIGATHRGTPNYILPRDKRIKISLGLKNTTITKETVFAYNEARKNQNLPQDEKARNNLELVYGPRLIVDGKVVGFLDLDSEKETNIIIDPSLSVPFVSITSQSVLEKARKLSENVNLKL